MTSILITGGAGSFGRAFVRASIGRYDRICIYSRGEHRQAQMREEFGDHPSLRWFIGDVRDAHRLTHAMSSCDIVVHAAALKRIEVGAYNPIEMVRTNVDGAVNIIQAAHDAAVEKVVALSTDKAYQPISAYGQSKALMESMMTAANHARGAYGPKFSVTRYGNVWWSEGSVGPRWKAMIDQGAPTVPCTNPNCTRFFMTMDQAVRLVMITIDNMAGGELVMQEDMPAYRLGDLAEAMGAEPHVTGLPAHEKMHEGISDGVTSDKARRMSIEELKEAIKSVS